MCLRVFGASARQIRATSSHIYPQKGYYGLISPTVQTGHADIVRVDLVAALHGFMTRQGSPRLKSTADKGIQPLMIRMSEFAGTSLNTAELAKSSLPLASASQLARCRLGIHPPSDSELISLCCVLPATAWPGSAPTPMHLMPELACLSLLHLHLQPPRPSPPELCAILFPQVGQGAQMHYQLYYALHQSAMEPVRLIETALLLFSCCLASAVMLFSL